MSGKPDPKPAPRERPARRARDPLAVKQATLTDRECWGCGRDGANGHHLIPKDWVVPGPDADWNTISLCGTGTSGCHGAYHGNPCYGGETGRVDVHTLITPAIVRQRIAYRLLYDRPEVDRLQALLRHLDSAELIHRFFLRQLGVDLTITPKRHALIRSEVS